MRTLATGVALLLALYVAIGVPVALAFVARGVDRIDAVAAASGRGFRAVILPGVVALWPLMLLRWVRGAPPPPERTAHKDAARPVGGP